LQKTANSGTCFQTVRNSSFLGQNTHFKARKMFANRRFWKAKLRVVGGVARSKRKEGLFWVYKLGILSPVIVGKFMTSFGPPLHAIPPGVFDQTGGWRIRIGAQSRLERGPDWEVDREKLHHPVTVFSSGYRDGNHEER
jgi:hypothetical protein